VAGASGSRPATGHPRSSPIGTASRFILVYGGRALRICSSRASFEAWSEDPDIDALVTVDYPMEEWTTGRRRHPAAEEVRLRGQDTSVFVCGPRIMNRFVAFQLLRLQVPTDQLFLSLERNMRCGVGRCGHCQYGPKFVCKAGPVFSLPRDRERVRDRGDLAVIAEE
jgi:NAD(P)H-flavin reductase